VYIVSKKDDEQVLYIGMCGKIWAEPDGPAKLNNSRFPDRVGRWTPYAFQRKGPHSGYWECGPLFKNENRPPVTSSGNYRDKFHLSTIRVEFYCLHDDWMEISPTFLEGLLLQAHLSKFGRLPLGNREL